MNVPKNPQDHRRKIRSVKNEDLSREIHEVTARPISHGSDPSCFHIQRDDVKIVTPASACWQRDYEEPIGVFVDSLNSSYINRTNKTNLNLSR